MLGQFNIARARWPLEDPRMAGFTEAVDMINDLAERMPGFFWRMDDETDPGAPRFPGDPRMTFTVSAWRDLDSLRRFTWLTVHRRFRLRRAEWFEVLDGPYLAIWPIAEGHRPDGAEALAMLERLSRDGPSEAVFGTEALSPAPAD